MEMQNEIVLKTVSKVGSLVKEAIEKVVTTRTRKYKDSNDSLRKEQAAMKLKLEGVEDEFKPVAARLRTAEQTVKNLEDRIRELKLTIEAIQKQNVELSKKQP